MDVETGHRGEDRREARNCGNSNGFIHQDGQMEVWVTGREGGELDLGRSHSICLWDT